jgi:hypothetical protein
MHLTISLANMMAGAGLFRSETFIKRLEKMPSFVALHTCIRLELVY